jgi:sec-independent protein translocase protein TatB
MTELVVIMVVALIVFGPTRLPELARSLGRAMGEFRRASTDIRQTFTIGPGACRQRRRRSRSDPRSRSRADTGGSAGPRGAPIATERRTS